MFELISIICYGVIGFGIGGIAFKGKDAKNVNKLFGNFRISKEDEISQIKESKEKDKFQVQQLTKENTELQKQYNRLLRNIELLQMESNKAQIVIEDRIDDEMDEMLKL